ncbi:hypothetical protein CBE01nite_10440 [Clostridium beijerinckii]|uniref:Uncharacterized protein n=1 Tax=Clostridium diolis TaxID=223919 RepID=A0AAV3W0P4_9CLOT|nr:hypothetical protein CDIOL_24670 [Clostridium diolis]GEP63276.1 hypothetical protein CBE01nite_10440 [Clostridium beijerinckii]
MLNSLTPQLNKLHTLTTLFFSFFVVPIIFLFFYRYKHIISTSYVMYYRIYKYFYSENYKNVAESSNL